MNSAARRLRALRAQMAKRGIDLYIIPDSDFHGSEYTGDYFKAREYVSGFTGSAGTAVVMPTEAFLWTDGRYFIQAEKQLDGSGIVLQRMGEEGVPEVREFVKSRLKKGWKLGFDGRVISAEAGEAYEKAAEEKGAFLAAEEDLIDAVWKDRPQMPKQPFFLLEEKYSGRGAAFKIADVRREMERLGADAHILTSLTDIAWLLNLRGGDIPHVPVVMSYLVLDMRTCVWFVQEEMITEEQRNYLKENHIETRPYGDIYDFISSMGEKTILYDRKKINYRIQKSIPDHAKTIQGENPTEHLKAVKNLTEAENIRKAHIKDGVAVTKFIRWLKTTVGKEPVTELSAADYLLERRKEQEHFLDESFDAICAYGANAAMMHYQASPESHAKLKPEGFFLTDSGGHYLEGTTDITRTIALGPLTDQMKRHFTAVLRANINLASAKFLYGCRGINLDLLAREPLWEMGLDYKCGTGHGVGYLLNVHEGPNAFRWKQRTDDKLSAVLEEGMITTDEPGVYIESEYGIRIENELLCKKAEKNEYGQFMQFETITYAPIDLDAVEVSELTRKERLFLNAYHEKVYETLSPYLTEEERLWLKENTRAV